MNPEYADIELIERYLEGKLSSEELLAFENKVQQSPDFAQQVKAQKLSNVLLEEYEFVRLKKQMQLEMPSSSGGGINNLLYAGVALMVGIAGYFILSDKNSPSSTEKVSIVSTENSKTESGKVEELQSDTKTIVVDNAKTNTKNESIVLPPIKEEIKTEKLIIETPKDNTTAVSVVKDTVSTQKNCSELILEHTISKESTCEGKNTGSIKINIIKGGVAPYKYRIDGKGNFTSSDKFNFLPAGEYYLSIKESSGCTVRLKEPIKIEEKKCYEPFNTTFMPSQESVWRLPVEAGKSAKIKFHNKSGLVVHEITVQNGQPSEWDGINIKGEETPPGYYYVTIELLDGTIEYGYLTINR